MNEDKLLSKAVEIASSPRALSMEEMISIIIESTGVSSEIAEEALKKAIQDQKVIEAKDYSHDIRKEEHSFKPETLLCVVLANVVAMYFAYTIALPAIIGDRSIIDFFQSQPTEEIQ